MTFEHVIMPVATFGQEFTARLRWGVGLTCRNVDSRRSGSGGRRGSIPLPGSLAAFVIGP